MKKTKNITYKDLNLKRLDLIIEDCMSTSKYSEALKAIDILNKIVGAYAPEKQEVITNEHIVVF